MDVREHSDILEFGFGWGNSTLAFAMLGHSVTAVDIEPLYCELVRRRAAMFHVHPTIVNSDFLWVETCEQQFDAICFFESFHHCWEFPRLLTALHRVLRPGGKVYFGAEPINREFTVPWGVRLDGESLFVARKAGWMELGFHSDFFEQLLWRTGWLGRQCDHPHFWVATPKSEPIVIVAFDSRMLSMVGVKKDGLLHIEAPGNQSSRHFAAFGPYIHLPKGSYWAEFSLSVNKPPPANAVLDVCSRAGQVQLSSRECTASDMTSGAIGVEFSVRDNVADLEVRLNVPGGFSGSISKLSLLPLGDVSDPIVTNAPDRIAPVSRQDVEIAGLGAQNATLGSRLGDSAERLASVQRELAAARADAASLRSSTSWRITAPMRALRTILPKR